jgi:hypothetical protein
MGRLIQLQNFANNLSVRQRWKQIQGAIRLVRRGSINNEQKPPVAIVVEKLKSHDDKEYKNSETEIWTSSFIDLEKCHIISGDPEFTIGHMAICQRYVKILWAVQDRIKYYLRL